VGIFHLDLVALWSGLRQNVRGLLGPGLGLTFETYIGLGFGLASDRTKNNTRQLHESFVIKWMCKYECRTHREQSFVIKINTTLKLNVS
jgi:hypothetical protein